MASSLDVSNRCTNIKEVHVELSPVSRAPSRCSALHRDYTTPDDRANAEDTLKEVHVSFIAWASDA
jgi:hypothetical protein